MFQKALSHLLLRSCEAAPTVMSVPTAFCFPSVRTVKCPKCFQTKLDIALECNRIMRKVLTGVLDTSEPEIYISLQAASLLLMLLSHITHQHAATVSVTLKVCAT